MLDFGAVPERNTVRTPAKIFKISADQVSVLSHGILMVQRLLFS
jgi:hypothetical protein